MWLIFTVKLHFSYFLHRLLFFCISYFSGRDEILWFGLHVWPKSTDASVKNRTSSDRPHFRDKGTIWGGGGLISYYILTRLMALEFLMVASVLVLTQWSEEVWVWKTHDFLLVAFGFGCFLELRVSFHQGLTAGCHTAKNICSSLSCSLKEYRRIFNHYF